MTSPFVGEIRAFGFNFPPRGWAFCNGSILPIQLNTALFSLLGTTYGGNGQTTFALPDLRGRLALNTGQGPGLSDYPQGEVTGTEGVTLLTNELPAHTHTAHGKLVTGANDGMYGTPSAARYLSRTTSAESTPGVGYAKSSPMPVRTTMAAQTIGLSGGGQVHENRQPFLVMNYCIAIQGMFPARN